jgi:hypothetical protein
MHTDVWEYEDSWFARIDPLLTRPANSPQHSLYEPLNPFVDNCPGPCCGISGWPPLTPPFWQPSVYLLKINHLILQTTLTLRSQCPWQCQTPWGPLRQGQDSLETSGCGILVAHYKRGCEEVCANMPLVPKGCSTHGHDSSWTTPYSCANKSAAPGWRWPVGDATKSRRVWVF